MLACLHACMLAYSFTDSLVHSLTYLLSGLLTCWLPSLLTYILTCLRTYLRTYLLTHVLTYITYFTCLTYLTYITYWLSVLTYVLTYLFNRCRAFRRAQTCVFHDRIPYMRVCAGNSWGGSWKPTGRTDVACATPVRETGPLRGSLGGSQELAGRTDVAEYKCKRRGHTKRHLAQKRNINVKWFSCNRCEFKCKTRGQLKLILPTSTISTLNDFHTTCASTNASKVAAYLLNYLLVTRVQMGWMACTKQ